VRCTPYKNLRPSAKSADEKEDRWADPTLPALARGATSYYYLFKSCFLAQILVAAIGCAVLFVSFVVQEKQWSV